MIHQRFELSKSNPTDVIIFSDSKSALEALQNRPYQDQITSEIALGINNLIAAHAVHVTLQCIPRHCNISGNETADKLAKIGATTTKNPSLHTKYHQTNTKKTMRRIG